MNRRIDSGCFVVLIMCLALAVFVTLVAVLLKDSTVAAGAGILAGVIGGAFLNTHESQEFLSRLWRHLEDFGFHWLDWVNSLWGHYWLDWVKKSRLRVALVVIVVISLVGSLAVGAKIARSGPPDQCSSPSHAKYFEDLVNKPTADKLDPESTFIPTSPCNGTVWIQLTSIAGNHPLDVQICFPPVTHRECGTWVTISAGSDHWYKLYENVPKQTQVFFYIRPNPPGAAFNITGWEAF